MRLDTATISLERRSVGECIDLALRFYRHHSARLLFLSVLFGGPASGFAAWRAWSNGDGWLWSAGIFFFLSPFLGASVVAGAGHRVFGDPFTIRGVFALLANRSLALIVLLPLGRILVGILMFFCLGLLWVPMTARYGHLSEIILLERLTGRRISKRLEDLLRGRFIEACGRFLAIIGFISCVGVIVFLAVDILSTLLFNFPIFFGKLSAAAWYDDWENLFSYDAWVVFSWSMVWWLMYPIARLAWFFCYLDARIRSEGWDIEIEFRIHGERLHAVG